ncbi:hypothetical protein D3C83_281900 [compost metagenome]
MLAGFVFIMKLEYIARRFARTKTGDLRLACNIMKKMIEFFLNFFLRDFNLQNLFTGLAVFD